MQELTHRAPHKAKPNSDLSYKCATPLISSGLICNGLELLYLRAQFNPPFTERSNSSTSYTLVTILNTVTAGQTSLTISGLSLLSITSNKSQVEQFLKKKA